MRLYHLNVSSISDTNRGFQDREGLSVEVVCLKVKEIRFQLKNETEWYRSVQPFLEKFITGEQERFEELDTKLAEEKSSFEKYQLQALDKNQNGSSKTPSLGRTIDDGTIEFPTGTWEIGGRAVSDRCQSLSKSRRYGESVCDPSTSYEIPYNGALEGTRSPKRKT